MVANPARGQLNRENEYFPLFPFTPEKLVSRDSSAVSSRASPPILQTQAESDWLVLNSRDSSRFPRRRRYIPSTSMGSVPSFSVHADAYRWRSAPRVHRGTGSVALKIVGVTGASFTFQVSPWTRFLTPLFFPLYLYGYLRHCKAYRIV